MKKVLFLDDRSDRIRGAIRKYPPPEYALTCVFTAKECIKKLNDEVWDIVSLDHDLGFEEFIGHDSNINVNCGMEVVRWITHSDNFMSFRGTHFIVHSKNVPMGRKMVAYLENVSTAIYEPWKYTKHITGIVTGSFDIIHPGYIRLFKDAKTICQHLTVAINMRGKRNALLNFEEKCEILYAIRYVDNVVYYINENELSKMLPDYDIKINGSDHDKTTRPGIPQYYHDRNHNWSTTNFIKRIKEEW